MYVNYSIVLFLLPSGVSTRRVLLTDPEMQESTHRRVMEIDLFAPWILTHDVLPGEQTESLHMHQKCGMSQVPSLLVSTFVCIYRLLVVFGEVQPSV